MYDEIDAGAAFYFDENDYLEVGKSAADGSSPSRARSRRMKTEATPTPSMILDSPTSGSVGPAKTVRKRPRRSAAIARSYVIPDSDDDSIAEGVRDFVTSDFAKKRRCETNLQLWIKHLGLLLKEEQRKVCGHADVAEAGFHGVAGKGEEETRTSNRRTWDEGPSAQGRQRIFILFGSPIS